MENKKRKTETILVHLAGYARLFYVCLCVNEKKNKIFEIPFLKDALIQCNHYESRLFLHFTTKPTDFFSVITNTTALLLDLLATLNPSSAQLENDNDMNYMTFGMYFYRSDSAGEQQAFHDGDVPFGARITQRQREGTVFDFILKRQLQRTTRLLDERYIRYTT